MNVGIAVAADDSLVVPTLFDADTKALGAISRETREVAGKRARGTITPPELSGGTFTVSNLGMYGIDRFTAIINPPQAAILSVGTVAQRAVVRDGDGRRGTRWRDPRLRPPDPLRRTRGGVPGADPDAAREAARAPALSGRSAFSHLVADDGDVRVLIVEDDVPMAAALRRALRAAGVVADVAVKGEDAGWMVRAAEYDAVVLDVMLPGADGFETCRRLRRRACGCRSSC